MPAPLQVTVNQSYAPMLKALDAILAKAEAFAAEKKVDLVNARIAPDMFTLARQVQIATYFAREIPQRLKTGESLGGLGDEATSIEGMRQRIADALVALDAASDKDFEGAETRRCLIEPQGQDMVFDMSGEEYLLRWSLPNFYFHLVTAYDILRKEGVEIGKKDYLLGAAPFMRAKAPA